MTSTSSIDIPDLASIPTVPTSESPIRTLPPPFNTSSPPPTLITQGAESLLYKTCFLTPSTPAALKVRPPKPYRHAILDKRLSKQRVLAEARIMVKLASLGNPDASVPAVYGVEWEASRRVKGLGESQKGVDGVQPSRSGGEGSGSWILMEWIEGFSVKEVIRRCEMAWKSGTLDEETERAVEQDVRKLLRRIGRAVGVMHALGGVVHGDLTSSNIMISPKSGRAGHGSETAGISRDMDGDVVLIDFGLASQTLQDEDRAVDLYVLERAFGSTHPRAEGWFDEEVLRSNEGYAGSFRGASVVLKRLEEVRLRGRKRSMVG